ncbi:hypothetical protein J2T57_001303 [Natronocella acetinitrilica]|uniref:Uncharacterized protein n=1 Tax=Natronocella acetinitrilica TaxID=414046 RepID=A0AAE3G3S5_9GAMM|nr:hypothetical protein [Natronocella acetinitrilica]MCP1674201.1 hypothetical protein [Natronocella acetinitrilica]
MAGQDDRARGFRVIVSSEEMRRISHRQQAERARDGEIAVYGTPDERRALRARNSCGTALPFDSKLDL